jgi:hypothetical protein
MQLFKRGCYASLQLGAGDEASPLRRRLNCTFRIKLNCWYLFPPDCSWDLWQAEYL